MPHPARDWFFIARETLQISVPTVVDALRRRVTVEACNQRLDVWSRHLVEEAGVHLEIEGRDAVDWSRAYVIMSNHQSYFDIPVLFQTVPGTMRMVTKKELFKVPIWGQAMRDAGFIEIDRQNRDRAIEQLKTGADKIRQGTHVWIAPEGTRSHDGRLLPLKKGGFRLAQETHTPILPVAVVGTCDVLRRDKLTVHRGKTVRVTFGQPIQVEGQKAVALMGQVRDFLEQYLPPSTEERRR